MDKKTLAKLFARFSPVEVSLALGVSARTVQGWKYGRPPSRWLHAQIKTLLAK